MSNAPKPGPQGKTPPAPAAPTVSTDDVAVIVGAPVVAAPEGLGGKRRPRVIVSQGAYDDLVRLRKVTHAGTGHELRVGADGKVTAYVRGTDTRADVDVICPKVPKG